jgi:hypothetical protein
MDRSFTRRTSLATSVRPYLTYGATIERSIDTLIEGKMTCEVAVMNKRGIALAADSAVTLGNGKKIYHTAEKLFSLSPSLPVAVMTFGAADMMNVPWETVVKIYAQKLGSRRFDTLDQYAKDFLSFVEGATSLFPPDDQKSHVEGAVRTVWSGLYKDKLLERIGANAQASERDKIATLTEIVHSDHEIWEKKYTDLEGLGADYGACVVRAYEDVITHVEKQVFEGIKLPRTLKSDLRKTVSFMYGKQWFHPAEDSGVVIAGMGESEPFPVLYEYRIGTVTAGKLRYAKTDEARVGASNAVVVPFAQRETIDMIIGGIHPRLRDKLIEDVERWMPNGKNGKAKNSDRIEKRKKEFAGYMRDEIVERYDQPFMGAVSALPRQDLAKMAEALVNLTAFLMRMNADKDETVAEPIDVALLSKGDGFIWVKHKNIVGV